MSKCNIFGEIDENLVWLHKVREKVAELLKSLSHNDYKTTPHMSYTKDTNPAFDKNSCTDNTHCIFSMLGLFIGKKSYHTHNKCTN
jgi:hypothetical protein